MGLISNNITLTASLATGTSASAAAAAVGDEIYNQKTRSGLVDVGTYVGVTASGVTALSILSDIATAEAAEIDDLNITNEYIQSLSAEELKELSQQLQSLDLEEDTATIEAPRQIR